jgi:Right handed beta helix region/Secretion system C-terminal sorting domain
MKLFINIIFLLSVQILWADILHVPAEYLTIQAGINAAIANDTVLIANGSYTEQLVISEKSITLASNFLLTGDRADITQTIIDGNNDIYVLAIESSAGNETSILGLTIQNADDGIYPKAPFSISNCIIRNCDDGIDYEDGSGGICQNSTFENNTDDGIDLDGGVGIIIENNIIVDNTDDGIEVRLEPYTGTTLNIIIKNNFISGNSEDGIQLIDYPGLSDRIFYIENNLIINNAMVGVGCIDYGPNDNYEFYEGTSIPESIFLINNTISGNNHGVTGGANLIAYNNIVADHIATAMKNVNGSSLISYSNFWNNGENFDNSINDESSLILSDPLFISASDYHIQDTSPCIGNGNAVGCPIIDIEYIHRGNPPDIGAYENISDGDQTLPVELISFEGNQLNENIELVWITESELNNIGYEIYVKEYQQKEFKLLASYLADSSLEGLGNSSSGKKYKYIHKDVIDGLFYSYILLQYDYSGVAHEYGPVNVYIDANKNKPGAFTLDQNCPNPFNPSTVISYDLKSTSTVALTVYNMAGREIKTLVKQSQAAGEYSIFFDASSLASGIYIYKLKAGPFELSRKMLLLK